MLVAVEMHIVRDWALRLMQLLHGLDGPRWRKERAALDDILIFIFPSSPDAAVQTLGLRKIRKICFSVTVQIQLLATVENKTLAIIRLSGRCAKKGVRGRLADKAER